MAASKELTDDVRLAHLMADDADSLSMNRFKARDRNVGWRIDYFFVSEELRPKVKRAWIDAAVMGSDHCPVGLELDCR